jgi:hypothetical protein
MFDSVLEEEEFKKLLARIKAAEQIRDLETQSLTHAFLGKSI